MQSTDSADGSHSGLRASRPEPRSNSPGTSPQAAEEAVSRPSGLLILSARLWFGRPWGVDIASRAAVNRRRCIRCSLVVRPDLAARIAAVVIHPRILADGFQKSARPAAFRAIVDGHCWHWGYATRAPGSCGVPNRARRYVQAADADLDSYAAPTGVSESGVAPLFPSRPSEPVHQAS
jgi:hypothetical protein